MAGSGKKWLLGCGIGCGLMILLTAVIGGVGYVGVKKFIDRAEDIEDSAQRMIAEYGDAADFVPRADGHVSADRMEVFLGVREAMTPVRDEVGGLFRTLDGEEGAGWMSKVKAGVKFLPSLLVFIEERNKIMMDQGMGVGEYQYIYSLSYYGLLGKDPSDGPGFAVVSHHDEDDGDQGFRWQSSIGEENQEDVRRERERELRKFVNRVQSHVLTNQLQALDEGLVDLEDIDRAVWREQLAAEAAAMARESLRLLWEEGLPPRIRDSLEPYRMRLDATYDPMTSILEMGLVDED